MCVYVHVIYRRIFIFTKIGVCVYVDACILYVCEYRHICVGINIFIDTRVCVCVCELGLDLESKKCSFRVGHLPMA